MILWLLFLVLILFFYARREGFIATSYSQKVISDLTNYYVIQKMEPSEIKSMISDYQEVGVPEPDVNTFLATKKWPYSQESIEVITKQNERTPAVSLDSLRDSKPQEIAIRDMAKTSGSMDIQQLMKSKISCKVDSSGNSIQSTMYLLNNDNVMTDPVENADLPKKVPGFQFLGEPCNPCNILNSNYSCPFSVPDQEAKPILPLPVLQYVWGIFPKNS